ncbi:site-specific integrase [Sphingomonas profundi]|uniref:site-specific integrase n=1 Tax=Alterirhizorhabdus profundi TaxID=2681549 RepID=UPI0012E85BE6|nr:site-specific integrase [Sphingomonas profundi]
MVTMATPWRHPETGTFYIRRQIPKPLRDEFGGRQLFKRSLDTKDPDEARRLFPALNAELEQQFARARAAIAERTSRTIITPAVAADAVARISAAHVGGRLDRFPVLANIFWAEEAASTILGGAPIATFNDPSPQGIAAMDPACLPGDLWMRVIRTRSRADALRMAEHMIVWVHGGYRDGDGFADLARSAENDIAIMNAVTAAVEREQVELRLAISTPVRPTTSRLRPDMRLGELLEAWKTKTPAPGAQGAHEACTTVIDFIDFMGDVPVSTITADQLYNFRDAVAVLPASMPRADRALTFNARLAKYGDGQEPKVAPASVKRRIGHLQALLKHAFNKRWIASNAGAGIHIEGYSKHSGFRRPFLDDELARLFASDLFVRPQSWSSARNTVSDRSLAWLFLLGLTNGARIEEIGQTELVNVKTDGGIRYLDLGIDAQVKNETSRRMIPLHGMILRLGFDDYVSALRGAGETRLFPELRSNKFDKLCQAASQVANRVIDRVVGDDPRLAFHSLRHNFKDLARDATIEKYILDQIMGHAGVTTGDGYGIGARLKTLGRELDRVTFDMVDWSPIISAFNKVDWSKPVRGGA